MTHEAIKTVLMEVSEKMRCRALIDEPDPLSREDLLRIAKRSFYNDRQFFLHLSALCAEQVARIDEEKP